MGFNYLLAKNQTDTGSFWLSCVERRKEIVGVVYARTTVQHVYGESISNSPPIDLYGLKITSCLDGILDQIDHHLLNLGNIQRNRN